MTTSSIWLDIFLLCHNRPEFAKAAIQSILDQRAGGFQLTVSDNSSDDSVARMVQENFPDVRIKYRGNLPSMVHFNTCIAEARADYFCLFHDDDLMGVDFVSEMRMACNQFPDAVAIGANAWVVNLGNSTRVKSIQAFGSHQIIASKQDLFKRYFGRHQFGIAPFPSYIYRTAVAGFERLPVDGGKYADVSWLLHLSMLGGIVWWHKPLMDYHLHVGNDGLQESRRDRLIFLGVIKRCPACVSSSGLDDYRYFIYKKIVAVDADNPSHQKRTQLLRRFLRWQRVRRHLRLSELPAMLRKNILKLSGNS